MLHAALSDIKRANVGDLLSKSGNVGKISITKTVVASSK